MRKRLFILVNCGIAKMVILGACLISAISGGVGAAVEEETASSIKVQTDIVKAYIEMRDPASAKTVCDDLRARFASDPALPAALLGIARAYREAQYYPPARELCNIVIQNHPGSGEILHAWAQLAYVERDGGSDTPIAAALDGLKAALAPASDSSEAILEVAWVYNEFKRFDDARILLRYIIRNRPGTAEVPIAWADLAIIESRAKNEPAAAAAGDTLIAAFVNNPALGIQVVRVADDSLNREQWQAARDLYQ